MILTAIDPFYVLSGFLIGFLVGQTGVGGGSLMTPLLVLLFLAEGVFTIVAATRPAQSHE